MSFFKSVTQLPPDPILNLPIVFAKDPKTSKVNLGIGAYLDNEGNAQLLLSVKQAEAAIISKGNSKNYLPIDGDPHFVRASSELVFGERLLNELSGNIFAAQAVGGTSALRIGADFLLQETSKTVYIPNPSWPTHKLIFGRSGFDIRSYSYYDSTHHSLDFNAMCKEITLMPSGSVILLHACCHNPTGIDPTFEQWKKLSSLIKKHKLIPFFDFAYQGFGAAPDEDAEAVRYFASQGHEMLVANSFSKNFGLYGERVGMIAIITQDKEALPKISSQFKQLIRANYSNPPRHGALIVGHILQSPGLKAQWLEELAAMRNRMKTMRQDFVDGLKASNTGRDWSFMEKQHGFFSFTGLSPNEVEKLIKEHGIYMLDNGRINVAGLNSHNIEHVIKCISEVLSK